MEMFTTRGNWMVTQGEIYAALARLEDINGVDRSGQMLADFKMGGFNILDLDDIIFEEAGRELRNEAVDMQFRVPAGDGFSFVINNVFEYVFGPDRLDMNGNDLWNLDDIDFLNGSTLTQSSSGLVWNATSVFNVQINSVDEVTISSLLITLQENVDIVGDLEIINGFLELNEITAPAAPAANNIRFYAEDNGSGKTRLMAKFATGAAQLIAQEP